MGVGDWNKWGRSAFCLFSSQWRKDISKMAARWQQEGGRVFPEVSCFYCLFYLWQLKIATFANLMELLLLYTNLIWLLERHIFIRHYSLERYMKDLHTGEERFPFVYYFYYVAISKCVRDLKSQVSLMI